MQVALTTENKPELAIFLLNSNSIMLKQFNNARKLLFSELALEWNRNPDEKKAESGRIAWETKQAGEVADVI